MQCFYSRATGPLRSLPILNASLGPVLLDMPSAATLYQMGIKNQENRDDKISRPSSVPFQGIAPCSPEHFVAVRTASLPFQMLAVVMIVNRIFAAASIG
jgi:hypothetical protein